MAGVYWRRDRRRWCVSVKRDGRWRYLATDAKSKPEAERMRIELQRRVDGEQEPAPPASPCLADQVEPWIRQRAAQGLRNVYSERIHLVRHVVPRIGSLPVADVRVKHAVELIESLRAAKLAPRTVRHVHETTSRLWEDLIAREIVVANPWRATRKRLPKLVDKDPGWRDEADFTRSEVELLIASPTIPADRRVMHALLFLAGLRIGEAAGLRWKHLDASARPLGRLVVAHSYLGPTKTDRPRQVPVHPVLAIVLSQWKDTGWSALFGREPALEDPIVPGPPGPLWNDTTFRIRFQRDLERLGLRVTAGAMGRRRSPHGARGTFITLACDDGARLDVIQRVTHQGQYGGTAQRYYLRTHWPTLCDEVAKLKIQFDPPPSALGGCPSYQDPTEPDLVPEEIEDSGAGGGSRTLTRTSLGGF